MYDEYLEKLEEVGKLRNLKPRTIQTYQNNILSLLTWTDKDPETLTCEDARDFLVYLQEKGRTPATLNNKNVAMVFFFKRVLRKPWDDEIVPRAINEHPLPRILSRTEIQVLLDATEDLKYKAMFAVMYSAGLHVSEVIHLRYCDISRKTCRFMYAKPKPVWIGMQSFQKKRWICLLNTGLHAADQRISFSQISLMEDR